MVLVNLCKTSLDSVFDSTLDDWFDGSNWEIHDFDFNSPLDVLDVEKVQFVNVL